MTVGYFCDSCHLVKGWVEVAFVNWGFLFLHSLLSKHQPDFYVGICKARFSFYLYHLLEKLPDFPLMSFAFRFLACNHKKTKCIAFSPEEYRE